MDKIIETSQGSIAVMETEGNGAPVLFIHGNSSCKEVFQDQLCSSLGSTYRCIAMDLPGHGRSEDARQPEKAYTMSGYAAIALEVLTALKAVPAAVVGWSLGGHIGIEMLAQSRDIRGLVISGTPPISSDPADVASAFLPHPHMVATGQEQMSEEEADAYARTTCGSRYEAFLGEAVRRTDGRARRIMMEAAMSGSSAHQRQMMETTQVAVAVINGRDEPLVNNRYVQSITYSSLWQGRVQLMDDAGHAPFRDQPAVFNQLLTEFLASLD